MEFRLAAADGRGETLVRFNRNESVRQASHQLRQKARGNDNAAGFHDSAFQCGVNTDSGIISCQFQFFPGRFEQDTLQCGDRTFGRSSSGNVVDSGLKVFLLASDFQKNHLIKEKIIYFFSKRISREKNGRKLLTGRIK